MWNMKLCPCTLYLVSVAVLAVVTGVGFSQAADNEPLSVVHHPDQSGSLEARWQWALAQIPTHPRAEHVWIGFSTRRLMHENSFVGRWPVSPDYPTLSELVYGVRVELPRFSYSRQKTPRTVAKEVAYVFEVERASGRIERAETSDISLSVYLTRGVLFWLGEVGQEQAVSLFQSLYRSAEDDDLKIRLVSHVAEAQNDQALSFLDEVLQKEKSERVRRETVHELGGYDNQKSLEILLRTVRQDASDSVRRESVGTMGRLGVPGVENVLIEIAKAGSSPSVRREAIHMLSQRTSPAIVECLGSIINGQDQPRENQRAALETLARMESAEALDMLLQVAKTHADPRVRHEALDNLRGRTSPKVVSCLVSIINQDKLEAVQGKALEILARLESQEALDTLVRMAQTHANAGIRHKAIDELREHPLPGVISCLVGIVNQDKDEAIQRRALEVLAQMESQDALRMLIRVARTHANPRMREQAMDRLRDRASPEVRECLLSIINGKEEPERIQAKALETLASIEDEKTLEMLIGVAQTHSRPSIRRRAIEEFRRFEEWSSSSPAILNCLVSIINKKEELEEIRRGALDQLAEYGTKEAWDAMTQIAAAHADPRMRESAIDKLGNVDEWKLGASPDVTTCLVSVLNNRSEQERIQRKALEVLTRARDEKAQAILVQTATTHANPRLRQQAIDELGQTEELDDKALPGIIASLESIVDNPKEQEAIQRKALDTLKDIKHPSILSYLKKTGQNHPSRNIRRQAQEILAEVMAESWNTEK